jgi:hypothetical protein
MEIDTVTVKTMRLKASCTRQDVFNALWNTGYRASVTEVTRGLYEIRTLDGDEDKLLDVLRQLPPPLTLLVKQDNDSWQEHPFFSNGETNIDFGIRVRQKLTNNKRMHDDTSDEEEEDLQQKYKKHKS